jgi:glycolate oxidase FAD binding subunit
MADTLELRDDKDVVEAVGFALAQGKTIEVIGHGTRRGVGRAVETALVLDLSRLSSVTLYEPAELVLSAKAGTPRAEIEALLAGYNQMLAFEPPDFGPLAGGAAGRGTLGGVLAANAFGPRRLKAGAARDHFLGVAAVSGRGEAFKAGGRVVKNVTGFDVMKGLAGSWGTLAVMMSVTVKVLPAPDSVETVLVLGLHAKTAVVAMSRAMGSSCEVSGAAHLSAAAVRQLGESAVGRSGGAVTALRLEGVEPSIADRRGRLEALLQPFGELAGLGAEESRRFWREVRDLKPFQQASDRALWRVAVAPMTGAAVAEALEAALPGTTILLDQAGAVAWAELPDGDPRAGEVRAIARAAGGHATLMRAAAMARASAEVFEPEPPALAALTKRLKDAFDPGAILSPGRMWAGV